VLSILLSFFVFIAFLALTTSTGYSVLNLTINWKNSYHLFFRVGSAYFLGIAFLVAIFRSFTYFVTSPHQSIWITSLLALGLCLCSYKDLYKLLREILQTRLFLIFLTFTIFVAPLLLIFWLPFNSLQDMNPVHSLVGSLNSVKYAWVSNFINECKFFPILGQNTAQSILSYVTGGVYENRPFLGLFLWLESSIFFLSIFFYGIIRMIVSKSSIAFLIVVLIMFGNSALSFSHILVIDSGSPFGLSGYTDTLYGVFSVFFLFFLHHYLNKKRGINLAVFFLVVLILITNYLASPQNIILLSLLILFITFYSFIYSKDYRMAIFWGLAILLTSIISIPMGGMLTPEFFQTNLEYYGLMSPSGNSSGLQVYPGYPYHFGNPNEWALGQLSLLKELQMYIQQGLSGYSSSIWVLEQIIFNSVRVLFFPLLGIIAFYFLPKKLSSSAKQEDTELPDSKNFFVFGLLLFFIGFIICFPFAMNGYKWQFARFMVPAIAVGMFGFSLFVLYLVDKYKKIGRYIFICLVFTVLVGPLSSFLFTVLNNGIDIYSVETEKRKMAIEIFLGKGPELSINQCSIETSSSR